MSEDPDQMRELRAEIDAVERSALRRVEPGIRATLIAATVMVLLLATSLPWIGDANGWQVLLGDADPADDVGFLPRLFAAAALGFGVGVSALALLTRRWVLVWASALGCGYCVVEGMWAIWSRQTSEGAGPGPGMVLAVVSVVLLAAQWFRLAVSRE